MNNIDISYLMKTLNQMDKEQLANGLNKMNQSLLNNVSNIYLEINKEKRIIY